MNDRLKSINDVVIKYTGNIYSVGEFYSDVESLNNLNLLMELVDCQLSGIVDEYKCTLRCYEGSRIKSNKICKEYLLHLIEWLKDEISDE